MKTKIRRFTNEGLEKWKELYNEIFLSIDSKVSNRRSAVQEIKKGYTEILKKKVRYLKENFELTEELTLSENFNFAKKFKNSYELASELNLALKKYNYSDISTDKNLWDWLSLQLFDQIFVPGEIKGYRAYRYVLDLDWENSMRHLIRGPWWVVNRYGENAKIFTYTKPYQQCDFMEQFIKVSHLREMSIAPEICMKLYYDKEEDCAIPGTSKSKPGGFHRFRDKIAQFNKVKYLWDMKPSEVIKILPKEFDKFKNE